MRFTADKPYERAAHTVKIEALQETPNEVTITANGVQILRFTGNTIYRIIQKDGWAAVHTLLTESKDSDEFVVIE